MTPLPWLYNRYALTLGVIAILVVGWNLYVAFHQDGIITGRVVGPDNQPLRGASVVLSEKTLLVTTPKAKTTTDEKGEFRFTGHNLYHLYLEASQEGIGTTGTREFRLYFRGQNLFIDKTLRLEPRK